MKIERHVACERASWAHAIFHFLLSVAHARARCKRDQPHGRDCHVYSVIQSKRQTMSCMCLHQLKLGTNRADLTCGLHCGICSLTDTRLSQSHTAAVGIA